MSSISSRPIGFLDTQNRLNPDSYGYLAFQGEYSGTNLIYKGLARPGADTSAPVWQLALLTYDGSNNLLSITWPQNQYGVATADFLFSWDDRASYTYS